MEHAETPRRAAAFFDLDRTLISGSSAFPFAIAAWRAKMVPTAQFLRDASNAALFRLFGAEDDRANEVRDRFLGAIRDVEVEQLYELGRDILPGLVERVRPESRALLEMHETANRDRYIISAAPIEVVEALSGALGLEGAIGTRAEVKDGRYTGQLVGPFCYGVGKADAIRELADDRGYQLPLCYAYSDSASDLPMMELVGHPVAVNPDAALEEVAYQRGWPIVIFSRRAKKVIRLTTAAVASGGVAVATYVLGRRHGRIAADAQRGRAARLLRI